MRTAKRIDNLPPYLFAEIDRKKAAKQAQGIDVISLGIGDPDTPTPAHIVAAMEKAIHNPANHQHMVLQRERKVAGIAAGIPELEVDADPGADLLVVGWGSTYPAIFAGVRQARACGAKVARAHLRHLNHSVRFWREVERMCPDYREARAWLRANHGLRGTEI